MACIYLLVQDFLFAQGMICCLTSEQCGKDIFKGVINTIMLLTNSKSK